MSGGSFNYLCDTWDFEDLLTKQSSLEAMAQALAGLGYAKDAARETEELLLILRQWEVQASVRIDRLRDVWKAMEWWRSHDWSEDQFKEALAEYRGQGDAVTEEPEEPKDSEQGRPEPPSEAEPNPALPVQPDPRQAAYDAVYEYIRGLGGYLPPDTVHRNAVLWRAVNAALAATPVGRCVSSHCVEGDHILDLGDQVLAFASSDGPVPRCPSCEHQWDIHADDGCWHTVDRGRDGRDLVCACRVSREEAP